MLNKIKMSVFDRVKLRIKTDCQQFDLKEDQVEEKQSNDQPDNIDLAPLNGSTKENSSLDGAQHQKVKQSTVQSVSKRKTRHALSIGLIGKLFSTASVMFEETYILMF